MKTILVPTDFSDVAYCAAEYATEIAKQASAKLILFHAYRIPVESPDGMNAIPLSTIQENSIKQLKSLAHKLHSKHKGITIEYKAACGFAVDEINQAAVELEADLIVMGMQGGGYISEKVIGSITTALIKKSNRPILAIHKGAKFKPIKKIALACDFYEIDYPVVLKPLNDLVNLFNSQISILNVVQEMDEVSSETKATEGIKLKHALKGVKHSFHYTINNDVTEGISDFVQEHDIDLIAMIPHEHNVFEKLFSKSHTKHMAFQVAKPFLAIHDSGK